MTPKRSCDRELIARGDTCSVRPRAGAGGRGGTSGAVAAFANVPLITINLLIRRKKNKYNYIMRMNKSEKRLPCEISLIFIAHTLLLYIHVIILRVLF